MQLHRVPIAILLVLPQKANGLRRFATRFLLSHTVRQFFTRNFLFSKNLVLISLNTSLGASRFLTVLTACIRSCEGTFSSPQCLWGPPHRAGTLRRSLRQYRGPALCWRSAPVAGGQRNIEATDERDTYRRARALERASMREGGC